MHNVVVIGAGQIGSRHLQGIARCGLPISIQVVDPSDTQKKIAYDRYKEVDLNNASQTIQFYNSIDQLSDVIDVGIIATSSDIRSKVVAELLRRKKTRYLILEKVLFQSIEEYDMVGKILQDSGTLCWVNHPRRMYPFYQSLKRDISGSKQIFANLNGGDWGLGCNGLHFIDLLSYLADCDNPQISNEFLNKQLYNAKRPGYMEFYGTLNGKVGKCNFTLNSIEQRTPCYLSLFTDDALFFINESEGTIRISKKGNCWNTEERKLKIVYYQSELTGRLVEEIISKGTCDLPDYSNAAKLHIPFIASLIQHIGSIGGTRDNRCPIT